MEKFRPKRSLIARLKRRVWFRARRLKSLDAYALWAENYPPVAHNRLMEIEQAAMLRLMPDLKGCLVLDLACGSGRYGLIAEQNGATFVAGVDNSVPMLKTGIAAGIGYPLAQAAMLAIPFASASFDIVICGLAIGHLQADAMRNTMVEIARVMRPNGQAFISDFHSDVYSQGGRRTFTAANGSLYEVEHYPHMLSDYHAAAIAAGLKPMAVAEPTAEINGVSRPVILALHYQKLP